MAKTNFPTEEVNLPSKGYFYPKDNPLSSGKVEMKYMTAREEDILTSPNLLRKGTAVDKLLEALITDKKVKIADMMLGDKNALLIAARILAYGKEYKYQVQTEDGDTQEATIDLSQLKDKEVDVSKLEKGVNDFPFTLPNSQRAITFRFLTNQDETLIDMEIKKLSKISSQLVTQMTSRFKRMITSVDGNSDRAVVNTFIDTEFLSLDSLALRKHMTQITPDVDLVTTAKFDDGSEQEVAVEITAQFFWPTS
jgi:hypothetical protein